MEKEFIKRKFNDSEKLQFILNFYKKFKISVASDDALRHRIFTYFVGLCDFKGLPQVVSDENFAQNNSSTMYRGCKNINHHANTLVDHDYHTGMGIWDYGNGLYATDDKLTALIFAKDIEELILTLKFVGKSISSMKCKDYCDWVFENKQIQFESDEDKLKLETLISFYKDLPDEDGVKFKELFTTDLSLIALYLGYDAHYYIERIDHNDVTNLAILNRASICVSQSEFNRICEHSKNYKGGVIKDEKNTEEEFLNN